jgi:hypothetical protein
VPFLKSALSEKIGDSCIYLNLLGYQVLWWYLLADPYFSTRPVNIGSVIEKLLAFGAMLVFFYLPPRIFYLAEDLDLPLTGLGMLLANLPLLIRVLFGAG